MWCGPMKGPMGMGPHRRGGLRMLIVSILRQAPRNGAEVMEQIEITSQGWWRPSPGSVYPLLDQMQRDGIIQKREDGKYELTEAASQDYGWPWGTSTKQPQTIDEMVTAMNSYVSYFEDIAKPDRSKLTPYMDRLKTVRDRIDALLESQKS